jgi:hypothetical protein
MTYLKKIISLIFFTGAYALSCSPIATTYSENRASEPEQNFDKAVNEPGDTTKNSETEKGSDFTALQYNSDEEEIFDEAEIVNMESADELHRDKAELSNLISSIAENGQSTENLKDQKQPDTSSLPAASKVEKITKLNLTAARIWKLSDGQCKNILKKQGIVVKKPTFKTPLVKTPLLLKSAINGVEVSARWSKKPVNSVMDCRLIVALIDLCGEASRLGVTKIQFYSTYRPIKVPPRKCKKGKRGKRCRKRWQKYKKAKKGKTSQHRKALAIDIRWFTFSNGTVVDVLEDYERHSKKPPCSDNPKSEKAKFLKNFACRLHQQKLFNVMLTPNANKAHRNHFHFDITPNATWYIIR